MASGLNTNQTFVDNSFSVVDNADNTKVAQFQLSGITTGTTRTYSLPDSNGTLIVSTSVPTLTPVTVPGDYATLSAAIGAAETHILVTANVTETADSTLAADTYILLRDSVTVDMDNFQFLGSGTLTLQSAGTGTFVYAYGSAKTLVSGPTSLIAKQITFDNNSSVANTQIASTTTTQAYDNVTIQLPNVANTGIVISSASPSIQTLRLVGGGTTTSAALVTSRGALSDIALSGTWNTTAGIYSVSLTSAMITGLVNNTTSGIGISLSAAKLVNANVSTGNDINVTFTGSGNQVLNCNLFAGDIDFVATDNNLVQNISTSGSIDLSDSGSNNNRLNNIYLDPGGSLSSIAGDGNMLSNLYVPGALTIEATATGNSITNSFIQNTLTVNGDDNSITNSTVGNSGGDSITISAAVNRTIVGNCRTGTAITDNGTGSALANNLPY